MSTRIALYHVDAFTRRLFGGNPAAVCPLSAFLPDDVMKAIASENNLSETAFFVEEGSGFRIRWFTPTAEVDLCGHATLAAAFVIFRHIRPSSAEVDFASQSGVLRVERVGDLLRLRFPRRVPMPIADRPAVAKALGRAPAALYRSRDIIALFDSERDVRELAPDFAAIAALNEFAIAATAKGDSCDFVSRFFAPSLGIPEDPVTGSAHCSLIPFWAERLQKRNMLARQISKRGGEIVCEDLDDAVLIAGHAVQYLAGEICV